MKKITNQCPVLSVKKCKVGPLSGKYFCIAYQENKGTLPHQSPEQKRQVKIGIMDTSRIVQKKAT